MLMRCPKKIAKNVFFVALLDLGGTYLNVEGRFSIAVMWRSFEKIGAQTAEKKNSTQNIIIVGDHNNEDRIYLIISADN